MLDRHLDSASVCTLKVELVQTACYGVRVYTNTSWLANHVDTRATHAVSVIMQVDQVSTAQEETGAPGDETSGAKREEHIGRRPTLPLRCLRLFSAFGVSRFRVAWCALSSIAYHRPMWVRYLRTRRRNRWCRVRAAELNICPLFSTRV